MERPATFTGLSIHLECEADRTTAMNPCRSILAGAVTASIVDSTCFCQGGKKEAVSFVEKCWHSWEQRDICAVVMLDKNSWTSGSVWGTHSHTPSLCHPQVNWRKRKCSSSPSPIYISDIGTSLVVQWLRLCAPNAGDPGSIPGWETRSHMLWLRVHMLQLKIICAATKRPHMPQLRSRAAK